MVRAKENSEPKVIGIGTVLSWSVFAVLILAGLGAIATGSYLSALLCGVAALLAGPLAHAFLLKHLNVKISPALRIALVAVALIGAALLSSASRTASVQAQDASALNASALAQQTPIQPPQSAPLPTPSSCAPQWSCTQWSACSSGAQSRKCSDENQCNSTTSKPAETENCTPMADELKNTAITVTYADLMRHPDAYAGKTAHFRGKVIQLQTLGPGQQMMRLDVSYDDFSQSNIILVTYSGNGILENDIVDVWGTITGSVTYTSILGLQITVPQIISQEIEVATLACTNIDTSKFILYAKNHDYEIGIQALTTRVNQTGAGKITAANIYINHPQDLWQGWDNQLLTIQVGDASTNDLKTWRVKKYVLKDLDPKGDCLLEPLNFTLGIENIHDNQTLMISVDQAYGDPYGYSVSTDTLAEAEGNFDLTRFDTTATNKK